jgi:3-carboxy-cis,cis-muconate cycloisomerase
VDTANILRLRDILKILRHRLTAIIEIFARLADEHRNTVMLGRTRSQHATPTTLGLKITAWCMPLIRHRQRLTELTKRLLVVQLGGAAGTLAAMQKRGIEITKALAKRLSLSVPVTPWHSQRDNLVELANWLAMVTGSLGKFGRDLVLLAQSDVGEISAGSGGGSSTMPQKANPIGAEMLVTLAKLNSGLVSAMQQVLIHEHERDGASWQLERLTLPEMILATSSSLSCAQQLADTLVIDEGRIKKNLESSQGLVLAEAVTFALAKHISRAEALTIVKAACATAVKQNRHLIDVVADESDLPIDWSKLKEPHNYLGDTDELINRMILTAKE